MSTAKVHFNGEEITLPPITGRKFIKLGAIIRTITKDMPGILGALSEFTTDYERDNQLVLSRAQALMRFGPTPVYVPMLGDDGQPKLDALGDPVMIVQTDDAGQPVMGPGRLDHLTDEDWKASGEVLSLPRSPGMGEQIAAIFPLAFDAAEQQIVQLIGLMLIDNRDLNAAARESGSTGVTQKLSEAGERALDDAPFEDLVELLVVAAEAAQAQYGKKIEKLGDRVGKALALFGLSALGPKSETSTTNTPTSSTDSEAPTAGPQTQPSTESISDSYAGSAIG